MRIGIDVGGTNTDAVVLQGRTVLGAEKRPTTEDVSSGIEAAAREALRQAGLPAHRVEAVMIGTTHFTNAVAERRDLLAVAVVRAARPAGEGLPPLLDWPPDLAAAIGDYRYSISGGYEYDGREIAPLDEAEVRSVAREIRRQGLSAVAVSSVFAPVNGAMEERIAELIEEEVPGVSVTRSGSLGRLGLLERENAAVLNASLIRLAGSVLGAFGMVLDSLSLSAPLFISQNDGTLMSVAAARLHPISTFASGPTNSMRGAGFLSGLDQAVVVDVGGTTTDVGALRRGFPRESGGAVEVGGVRTNLRMPDLLSLGLGGGSLVVAGDEIAVGPRSVGYRLTERALVFGGDTLTATDVAVAAGRLVLGDPERVSALDPELVSGALDLIHRRIEEAVDRMRSSAEPLPVILVGGGADLLAREIAGASEVVRPLHAAIANAIGAAIANVGGEVDRVYSYEEYGRDRTLALAVEEAVRRARQAGADPESVEVVAIEEVPLAYLPGQAVRVRVKAVGTLGHPAHATAAVPAPRGAE